jgi:hypothetical protein
MSTRSSPFLKTYAALVVVAALFAYILLVEAKKPDMGEGGPKEKALAVERDKVREIVLAREGGDGIRLVKQGEGWRLASPLSAPADATEVDSLLSSIANLEIAEVVTETPARLSDFGLEPAKASLTLGIEGAAEPARLLLGDKAPDGANLYAKLPAQARVFVIPSHLESSFDKKPFDLRDRDVMHVKRDAVKTLEVRGPEGSYALSRDDKGEWAFTRPVATRAGRWSVDGLIGTIENLRMDSVAAEDAGDLRPFGLDKPARTVALGLADGGRKLLEIGKPAEFDSQPSPAASPGSGAGAGESDGKPKPSKYYARDAAGALVAVVPAALVDDLAKGMGELRAKRVLEVATYEVEGVEVSEAGGAKKVYARSSTKDDAQGFDVYKWKRTAPDEKELDTNKVQDALFKIGGIEAGEFVDSPGPFEKYGLDKPVLRIDLKYAEGKPPAWLEVGKAGGEAYARRPDDSAILKLDPAKVDELIKAFAEL